MANIQNKIIKNNLNYIKRLVRCFSSDINSFLEFERTMQKKKELSKNPSTIEQSKNHVEPPIEPKLEDCCGNGCPNCVFIQYQEELLEYQAFLNKTKGKTKS